MFIRQDGSTVGSLGNPELDESATEEAFELMVHGKNKYVVTGSGAEYFIEAYTTPPQLVLCGGGHVSKSIAPLAKTLGFRVFVTDDREEFANAERFPEADIIVAKKPEDALGELPINPNTFHHSRHTRAQVRQRCACGCGEDFCEVCGAAGEQAQDYPHIRGPVADGHLQ